MADVECEQFVRVADDWGRCKLGLFGGSPTKQTCQTKCTWRPRTELEQLMEDHHDDPLLGDRLEVWAKKIGADEAAKQWEKWTRLPCGCGWRKKIINRLNATWRSLWSRLQHQAS